MGFFPSHVYEFKKKLKKIVSRYSNTEFEWDVLVAAFDADDDEAAAEQSTHHSSLHFTLHILQN